MADMLATVADLRLRLQNPAVAEDVAELLLETATGLVQAEVGQRLATVADDEITLLGTTARWLDLPQRPVTGVAAVSIDGTAVTDYKRFGARLYRACGWATCPTEPAEVAVTYSHGYPDGDQRLQAARSIVLAAAATAFSNPGGVTAERIDDYYAQWAAVAADMHLSEHACKALRKAYGRRGGLVKV